MNPFAPPTTDVDMAQPAKRKPVAFVLLGLAGLQLLWLLRWMPGYWELIRTGAANYPTGLGGFIGCILLYVAATRFALNAARGNRLFIAAIVCLAGSIWGWGFKYSFYQPYAFAAAIAAAGWWFSRGRAVARRVEG